MINDGTRSFDHQTDGSQQTLSGCQKDFRNKPFPVHVKVTYLNHVLTVMSGYFGVSAATGGLADDHDILDFSVYSLFTEADKTQAQQQIPQDERTKYDAEFDNQMKKFEEERKKFKEEHPDKARDDEEDPSKYYEDTNARELRLIYESQTAIHRTMQQMELKLQEINQQQHVHTSLIQQGSGAAVAQQQVPQGGAPPPPPQTGGFQQHEKNEVINSLRDLTTSQKLGTGAGAVRTPDDSANIRQNLDNLVNEVRQIRSAQLAQTGPGAAAMGGCANLSCISSTLFMVIVAVQSGVILAFISSGVNMTKPSSTKNNMWTQLFCDTPPPGLAYIPTTTTDYKRLSCCDCFP
uniref:L-type lectin-like domain-containing protein n=1 Tax=Ditylenchus dipsaci TaxID=166011 RepID=A0A915ERC1_9BILA